MASILIVDDAAFMRSIVKSTVTKLGHNVVGEGANGEEAEEKYRELRPDIVLMDITMPKVTGLEGIKRIKNIDSKAKIIMCSAMGQEGMIIEAIKNGAMDFIVKPFKANRIEQAINGVLGK